MLDTHSPGHDFVTVLREPVSRWESNYLYSKQLPDPNRVNLPSRHFRGSVETEFEKVIASGMGLIMGSLMTSFLSGSYPRNAAHGAELSAIAQQNLRRFTAVGFLEELDLFAKVLLTRLNLEVDVQLENRTDRYDDERHAEHVHGKNYLNKAAVRSTIAELCAPDTALFEFAKTLDIAAPGPSAVS